MSDETRNQKEQGDSLTELSRRDFVAMSIAAGIVAATAGATAADMPVKETDVEIKTPDGVCNAAFIHPTTGSHPGVLIWSDAFGLRPALREMGRRLAAEGYSVLAPNPFYRVTKDPQFNTATFSFTNQADRAKLTPLMGSINAEGAAEKDAVAFIAWLDTQKEVNKSKKIGTQGYCMGGPLVMRTAAAVLQPRWRRRIISRRWPGHRRTEQPASSGAEDSRADVFRCREERRRASAGCEG